MQFNDIWIIKKLCPEHCRMAECMRCILLHPFTQMQNMHQMNLGHSNKTIISRKLPNLLKLNIPFFMLLYYCKLQICWFNKCLLDWIFYKSPDFQALCSNAQWILPGIILFQCKLQPWHLDDLKIIYLILELTKFRLEPGSGFSSITL
jgi:hypothetical protein